MTTKIFIALALLILSFPTMTSAFGCDADIKVVGIKEKMLGYYENDTVFIKRGLRKTKEAYAIQHECGHHIESKIQLPPMFGKEPFITKYAGKNAYEDFSEIYAVLTTRPAIIFHAVESDERYKRKVEYVAKYIPYRDHRMSFVNRDLAIKYRRLLVNKYVKI